MESQQEWASPPKISAEFSAALAAAQGEMVNVAKDRQVEMKLRSGQIVKYWYATFGACLDVVRPAWTKHGISFTFDVRQELCDVEVETDSGQPMKQRGTLVRVGICLYFKDEVRPYAPTIFSAPSLEPRAIGSAMTYAKRYQLANAAGLAADEDDDGDGAQPEPRAEPRAQRREEPGPSQAKRPPPPPPPTDPASEALAKDFERRIIETTSLDGQIELRMQIRSAETARKAALMELSFERSIALAKSKDERRALAAEVHKDALNNDAKTRLNKKFREAAPPATEQGAANG